MISVGCLNVFRWLQSSSSVLIFILRCPQNALQLVDLQWCPATFSFEVGFQLLATPVPQPAWTPSQQPLIVVVNLSFCICCFTIPMTLSSSSIDLVGNHQHPTSLGINRVFNLFCLQFFVTPAYLDFFLPFASS